MGEACKVHVGNLSYGVTEDALFAAFEKCGAVDQGWSKELDMCWILVEIHVVIFVRIFMNFSVLFPIFVMGRVLHIDVDLYYL